MILYSGENRFPLKGGRVKCPNATHFLSFFLLNLPLEGYWYWYSYIKSGLSFLLIALINRINLDENDMGRILPCTTGKSISSLTFLQSGYTIFFI